MRERLWYRLSKLTMHPFGHLLMVLPLAALAYPWTYALTGWLWGAALSLIIGNAVTGFAYMWWSVKYDRMAELYDEADQLAKVGADRAAVEALAEAERMRFKW